MWRKNWRLAGVLLATMVAVAAFGAIAFADGSRADPCYEDVVVSGAGTGAANNAYEFFAMLFERPAFAKSGVGYVVYQDDGSGYDEGWYVAVGTGDEMIMYYNPSSAMTPPADKWEVYTGPMFGGQTNIAEAPAPTLSGGGPCGGDNGGDDGVPPAPRFVAVVGTGDAGAGAFLDSVLTVAEGEEAPMAGNRVLSAVFTVGDVISGSCQLVNADGKAGPFGYVHVYLYLVGTETSPETLSLVTHFLADYDYATKEYQFSIDTTELEPGYYDVHLAFPGSSQTFRIQLMP